MTAWYYEDNGQARGPVDEPTLTEMFAHRLFPSATYVWTAEYGDAWRSASDAGLAPTPRKAAMPPPLPYDKPTPRSQAVTAMSSAYDGRFGFLLGLSPLGFIVADVVMFVEGGAKQASLSDALFAVTIILMFVLGVVDAERIKKSGAQPTAGTPHSLPIPVAGRLLYQAMVHQPGVPCTALDLDRAVLRVRLPRHHVIS